MQDVLNTLKALSDDTRLRILKLLEHGELCVCDIVASLDTIQPKISFHLKILKEAGLIKDRKQGKWTHYSIDDADMFRRFLVLSVLERISDIAVREDRKRLEAFLKNKDPKDKVVPIKSKTGCCGRG
ncbi:MAG: metalloregulator ArsR/SmtB family transcription factor [Nitrospirota bacterium]